MLGLTPSRLGVLMAVCAYTLWGMLPLYLRALSPLPALDIMSHRVLWSLLLLAAIAILFRRGAAVLAVLRQPRMLLALLASTLLIGGNWLLYIYVVNAGHALEASLGYFINPLINVLLGVIVLRERLGRPEIVAIALAGAGVIVLTVWTGALPLIPFGLALTFGFYGLVRKMIGIGPVEGLLIETALLGPLALAWLCFAGTVLPAGSGPSFGLLMLSGLMTTTPLLLFNGAAQRIRYSDLGLLQYIGPTLQMLIAIHIFHEPLLPVHIVTFALIWSGLAVYGVATWRRAHIT